MSNRADAERKLVYYFKLVFQAASLRWDNDNAAEVASIIESIFDEIDKEVENHNNVRISHKH
jgi:hypothetical protein